MSLIKLKKQEMETQVGARANPRATPLPGAWAASRPVPPLGPSSQRALLSGACRQVRVLELEKTLEAERVRLGELRKQHYALAVGVGTPAEEEPGPPSTAPHSGTSRKPPLAQKPSVAPRQDHQVGPPGARHSAGMGRGPGGCRQPLTPGAAGHRALGRSETLTSRSKMLTQQHGELGSLKGKM